VRTSFYKDLYNAEGIFCTRTEQPSNSLPEWLEYSLPIFQLWQQLGIEAKFEFVGGINLAAENPEWILSSWFVSGNFQLGIRIY
jgi:hypothetical protein